MSVLGTPGTSRAASRSPASLYGITSVCSPNDANFPNVVDADVISAFLSETTYESLIHKLDCLKPRTTHDLLDVATNHASGEEAVRAVFNGDRDKGKAKCEDQDEGLSI